LDLFVACEEYPRIAPLKANVVSRPAVAGSNLSDVSYRFRSASRISSFMSPVRFPTKLERMATTVTKPFPGGVVRQLRRLPEISSPIDGGYRSPLRFEICSNGRLSMQRVNTLESSFPLGQATPTATVPSALFVERWLLVGSWGYSIQKALLPDFRPSFPYRSEPRVQAARGISHLISSELKHAL
jgi:hypothetical protein